MSDLRYALRRLWGSPAFTAVAVLTLALGMGVSAAIFSVADAVMLAPLPYAGAGERVMVWSRWKRFAKTWVNPAEMRAYAERCPSLAETAYWRTDPRNLTGEGEAVRVGGAAVSANTFEVLGTRPLLGRGFTAEEDRPGGPHVAVLGYELWQDRYAGDAAVLGRGIELDGVAHTVVGVMPRGFALPTDFGDDAAEPTALWWPRAPNEEDLTSFDGHSDYGAARLRAGASVRRANAELRRVTGELIQEGHIQKEMGFDAFAVTLSDEVLGEHRPVIHLLAGAVGFLLLVSCANVANLLLARAEGRQREVALRSALGASRGRLLRQLLLEGLVLSVIAAGLSLLVAESGLALLRAFGPLHVPRAAAAAVDARTAGFALGLSFAVTMLFALAPALHTLRVDLAGSLKSAGDRTVRAQPRRRWRGALVVAETAFAVLLASSAALMARSLHNLEGVSLGFEPAGVLTAQLSLPETLYPSADSVNGLYARLLDGVRALPGVRHAGLLRKLPLGQVVGDRGLVIEDGSPYPANPADWQVASEGAAETLGLHLLRGRLLGADDVAEAPQVALINETMASRYWPGRDAVGRRFRMGSPGRPWVTVAGVVDDVRHNGITATVKPMFFRAYRQFHLSTGNPQRSMSLVIKTDGDPLALAAPARAVLRSLDPRVPLSGLASLESVVAGSVAVPRFAGGLLALFAGLALALAGVGVFGVLSYTVSERTGEMGVRLALGAEMRHLRRLVLGEATILVGAGVVSGVLMSLALTRLMRGLLFGVGPSDPTSLAGAAALLTLVGLLASWLPARRAARVDPMCALRSE